MKRPWQIWLLFFLCLAIAAPALAWLSLKALELDRAESLARRQAALDESVNLALWRMDTLLMPLLAQEAARPPALFQPRVASTPNAPASQLENRPEYVRLHFQAGPGGDWVSPQASAETAPVQAGSNAETEDRSLLDQLRGELSFDTLLQETPSEMVASLVPDSLAIGEPEAEQQLAQAPVLSNYRATNQSSDYAAPQSNEPQLDDQQEAGAQYSQNGGKGQNELLQRNRVLQAYAQQEVRGQRAGPFQAPAPAKPVRESASRAFWVGDKLLLARRVQIGEQTLVQGCWLDWPAIEKRLRAEAADLLPHLALVPIRTETDLNPARALATLPVQIDVAPALLEERAWSPIRMSLAIAWGCMTLAAIAMAVLLWGVVSLSERRAAFVAAVTHELRTPLTTFRMYSEMLALGIAPPESRQHYLDTLQREAVRLGHLVENVLSYARLERGNGVVRRSRVSLAELVESWKPQLAERAAQADLELTTQVAKGAEASVVATDSQAVGQILFNLVDNAAKYANGSDQRRIEISCDAGAKTAAIRVRDFGPGLTPAQRRKLFRPFSKTVQEAAVTAPGVGLGLALCRRLARDLGGRLTLEPQNGAGASFVLELPLANGAVSTAPDTIA
jgi:signal transduction histidine kinase